MKPKIKVEASKVVATKKGKNPHFVIRKVGILGYGEVGKAIHQVYKTSGKKFKIYLQDLNRNEFEKVKEGLDVLHVSIPYNPHGFSFQESVLGAIKKYVKDGIVIIHSSVGTKVTKELAKSYKFIVHSPVRGVHPHLAKGLKTFIKYVGGDDPGACRIAAEHLQNIGMPAMATYKSDTTELMKLLDTTYYGVIIAYHDYAQKLCEKLGVNFDMVMTHANNSYNLGYSELGRHDVIRPILYPPEGKIGGHCVVPNAKILKQQFGDHPLLKAILDLSE